jgi:hypothetical protein
VLSSYERVVQQQQRHRVLWCKRSAQRKPARLSLEQKQARLYLLLVQYVEVYSKYLRKGITRDKKPHLGERCEGDSRSLESTYCSREVDVADAKQGGVGKEVRLVITAI